VCFFKKGLELFFKGYLLVSKKRKKLQKKRLQESKERKKFQRNILYSSLLIRKFWLKIQTQSPEVIKKQ
jgi:hypothetical protein